MLKRSEIEEKYKWDLSKICKSDQEAEDRLASVNKRASTITGYNGKLSQSDEILLEALKLYYDIGMELEELYVYAHLALSEDKGNSTYQSLSQRAMMAYAQFETDASYLIPEITEMSNEKLEALMRQPAFADFKVVFKEIIRQKEHILSHKEERLLGLSAEMSGQFSESFSMLSDVDMPFPKVKGEDGKPVRLSHARYRSLLDSPDRSVRRSAFNGMYKTYKSYINVISAMYTGSIKKDIFYARARAYGSVLEQELGNDNVDTSVYHNLIDTIHNNLDTLADYCRLRKKALGLKQLHMYDLYVPIVSEADQTYTFEQAKALVKEGLAILGEDYIALLDQAFDNRWVDVYENPGKSSGAFCASSYLAHPYVLLNFEGKLDDVFTIAHELGHAMHSYYSNSNQPFTTANYTIFVAEVASTVNEVLLNRYLLNRTKDKKEKAYMLNHYLEQFRTTVIRQTMFAEFELKAHKLAEDGGAVNHEELSRIYYDLNKQYYGAAAVVDDAIKYEWARIPHFYSAYYVYKYATGFSAAVAIANSILSEGAPAVARYKEFLKSGSSDYPIALLGKAGVDLRTPVPVEACMKAFAETLSELSSLI